MRGMSSFVSTIFCGLAFVSTCVSQLTPAHGPAFEVASVKRALPGDHTPPGWWETAGKNHVQGREHGRYSMYSASLKVYLQMAYRLPGYRISGPAWMDSDRYDVIAHIIWEF